MNKAKTAVVALAMLGLGMAAWATDPAPDFDGGGLQWGPDPTRGGLKTGVPPVPAVQDVSEPLPNTVFGLATQRRAREFALVPTESDRQATQRAIQLLRAGRVPVELPQASFETLDSIKNGRSQLMAVYVRDFLRSPSDVVEIRAGRQAYRFDARSAVELMTVLWSESDGPVRVTVTH